MMEHTCTKPSPEPTELIRWLLALPSNSPELEAVARIRDGQSPTGDEPLLTLRDLSRAVGFDPSWLYKLGVREACGRRFAGRLRYRLSEVRAWLESPGLRTPSSNPNN